MAKLLVSSTPVLTVASSKLEKRFLFGVIRARGITGSRANAAILFLDHLFFRQPFRLAKSPFGSGSLVQQFGERLGQSIGHRLNHDRFVIVQFRFVFVGQLFGTDAGRDDETTNVVFTPTVDRRDVVGERAIVLLPASLPLLA